MNVLCHIKKVFGKTGNGLTAGFLRIDQIFLVTDPRDMDFLVWIWYGM